MKLEYSFLSVALPQSIIIYDGKELGSLKNLTTLPFEARECTVAIDSRTLSSGQLFLALRGEYVDAHDFLSDVLERGVSGLIINNSERDRITKLSPELIKNKIIICVPDTFQALIALAKTWRQLMTYPVVAITGSAGKTTTKEMIHSILARANIFACVSYKNQNTLVGVCLNILRMRREDKAAVFEVGISEKGEMIPKVAILRPTIGVITMVGHAHMQGLGQLSEIAEEKRKLFEFFKEDHIGIIFGDQSLLSDAYYIHPVIRFGKRTKNQVQARMVSKGCFTLKLYKEKRKICLKTNHEGNITNALAAATVGYLLNISFDMIIEGLEQFDGCEQRFETRMLKHNKGILVNDCYNANPESMRAAILAIHEMQSPGEKIAVLGDMLELGEKELFWHRQIGRVLAKAASVKTVILVGERSRAIAKTAPLFTKIEYAGDWLEAQKKLEKKLEHTNALVLVKASRGMVLDNLVNAVTE